MTPAIDKPSARNSKSYEQQAAKVIAENAKGGAPFGVLGAVIDERIKPAILRRVAPLFIGFVRRSGVRIKRMERGHVVCEMPLRGNKNHVKTMYAGALFTLAEFPGGVLYLSSFDQKKFFPIVTELNIKFLAPATSDVSVEFKISEAELQRISSDAEENGKASFELLGELKLRDGTVVAKTVGNYQLRSRNKPRRPSVK